MILFHKYKPTMLALALFLSLASITETQSMNMETTLNAKQQSIVSIAAFTTSGDIEQLKPALNDGLDAGLTINEVKEVLVQMYAYAGFPRCLGSISAFMAVVEERKTRGIHDDEGRDASPIPVDLDRNAYGARVRANLAGLADVPPENAPYQKFAPIIDTYLKEHLFADIFARDILTHQDRELATIACLASLGRAEGPLTFHMGAAMNMGLTEAQMHAFIDVLAAQVGATVAQKAEVVLEQVLATRKNKEH